MLRSVLALLLTAPAVFPVASSAQSVRASDMVTWRVRADVAAPGEEARIVFDAEIAEGWRLYAIDSPVGRPLVVTLDSLPDGFEAGDLRQSMPQTGYDEGFKVNYPYFSGTARVAQTLRVGESVAEGKHTVLGRVAFTVCDDSVCLAPSRVPFRVPVVVAVALP